LKKAWNPSHLPLFLYFFYLFLYLFIYFLFYLLIPRETTYYTPPKVRCCCCNTFHVTDRIKCLSFVPKDEKEVNIHGYKSIVMCCIFSFLLLFIFPGKAPTPEGKWELCSEKKMFLTHSFLSSVLIHLIVSNMWCPTSSKENK